jgi:hypothetical protein
MDKKYPDSSATVVVFPRHLLFKGLDCLDTTGKSQYSARMIVQRGEGLTATQRVYGPWQSGDTEEEAIHCMIDALKAAYPKAE